MLQVTFFFNQSDTFYIKFKNDYLIFCILFYIIEFMCTKFFSFLNLNFFKYKVILGKGIKRSQ